MASGKEMGGVGRNTKEQRDRDARTASGGFGASGGAGTAALTGGGSLARARGGVGRNDPAQQARDATKARENAAGSKPGGGTTTSWNQSPGATPNMPESNPLTEGAKGALMGPMGAAATALDQGLGLGIGKSLGLTDENGNPFSGPQRGWQPDRFKGQANMTGVGDPGSAGGLSADEREIAGRPYRADSTDETDDPSSETPSGDIYSDVMLKDRRKPVPTLKQMLESML